MSSCCSVTKVTIHCHPTNVFMRYVSVSISYVNYVIFISRLRLTHYRRQYTIQFTYTIYINPPPPLLQATPSTTSMTWVVTRCFTPVLTANQKLYSSSSTVESTLVVQTSIIKLFVVSFI